MNSKPLTREEYTAGWRIAWIVIPVKNYKGGDGSSMPYFYQSAITGPIADYSQLKNWTSDFQRANKVEASILASEAKLQFPFSERFTCEVCSTDSPTFESALAKQVLITIAFEQAGISTQVTSADRPFWWKMEEEEFSDSAIVQCDQWGSLSSRLLELSWETGTPQLPTIEMIQECMTHSEKGWLGLSMKKVPPTAIQAQRFIAACGELGLFAPGDPGPGGNLFGDDLPPRPGDILMKVASYMEKLPFERPVRPDGWAFPIATFQLRCAACCANANPRFTDAIAEAVNAARMRTD